MLTDTELKDFIQKHKDEILNNDWTAVYDDLWYLYASSLTDFLLNKVHINPLYYMRSVPTHFAYKLDIPSINIPNNITSIRESAFSGCSKLTSITISDGVTEIDDFAFYSCTSLTSITIPNSVTEIGTDIFYDCSSLTSITIPSSVTSIGYGAFSWCSSLTSITIPSSVTEIREWAFSNCSSLTSITLPNSLITIKHDAFTGCNNLKEIKYTGNQQQWNKLLAKSRNFANWICENKVKIIFI